MDIKELKQKFDNGDWVNPDWTDTVLTALQDNEFSVDEKEKKYPRVRGLRRIGTYLANVSMVCDVIRCEPGYSACKAVAYMPQECGAKAVSSSMAEATPENVNNEMIARHLLATAESRAEGRCWTKVLKLNCLTAEEMSMGTEGPKNVEKAKSIDDEEEGESCKDIQRKLINKKCKEMNIDIAKYAQHLCEIKELEPTEHIYENGLSKKLATIMVDSLDKVVKSERPVPEKLQGYQKGVL